MSLRDEILEQPDAARRQLGASTTALQALAHRLRGEPVASVVIAARGTSDHAAIYAQYVLGLRNRMSTGLATPSVLSLYGGEPNVRESLVIGISQSGASPDIVGVVEAARRQEAVTLAITNDPRSELATAAEFVIELDAGPERAVAATKTYTTSLLAIARLSAALAHGSAMAVADGSASAAPGANAAPDANAAASTNAAPGAGAVPSSAADELAAIPDAIAAALAAEPEVEAIARDLAGRDRSIVVGRGFEYATAREWALKLKELARVFADPYSAADFLHGPIALVQPGIPVLVLAPEGAPAAGQIELLRDLRDRGIDTVVVSDVAETRALGRWSIAIPAGVPEWLRPIVSIVPAQLFAYHLTLAKGLDPERPRSLSKVTRTR